MPGADVEIVRATVENSRAEMAIERARENKTKKPSKTPVIDLQYLFLYVNIRTWIPNLL